MHIDGIIDKTDVVLVAAAEEFEHQFAGGGVNRRELQRFSESNGNSVART